MLAELYEGAGKVAIGPQGITLLGPFGLMEISRNGLVTISKAAVGPNEKRDVGTGVQHVVKISPNGTINLSSPKNPVKTKMIAPL